MSVEKKDIRVRFAPSPTGFLHIGGARTAVFNWLYAKYHGGQFLLRIEDTDAARSDQKMVDAILNGLQWLGIEWDDVPVYQSGRLDYYRNVCQTLMNAGRAYKCFCTHERLAASKSNYRYDGHCRNLSPTGIRELENSGTPYVVRFKVTEGKTVFDDKVHGSLTFDNSEIEDFVILRSDGMPTYHLAVVADDRDMGISTVIRGDDHISNTPKQVMLYDALGWKAPEMAHVPLILGEDRKRLSKRHGATSVDEYRKAGYQPEAVFNFLALMGWSPGDDREILSKKELVDCFSLNGVSKSNAVFDEKKLLWLNGVYISKMKDSDIVESIIPLLRDSGLIEPAHVDISYVEKVVALLKQKIRMINDFVNLGSYFFRDPEAFEPKAVQKHWKDAKQAAGRLHALSGALKKLSRFDEESLEDALRRLADDMEIGAGKLIHPARLALTGYGVSPGIFELMEVLGRERVLTRLDKAVAILEQKE
ncbi:MAG: glutamate--tRNA ligase [candidate division KSB1 bacterium]|jgi:glutamyl-tRNA synthetase|nr:glutamate--tRNA ligase [candidate division KSB1 bacterium]